MERKSFEHMHCSVAQCLEVIGEWWSMLVIRDAFLGIHRFDDFQSRLGIARNVFAQRLAKLVDAGVLEKKPYQDNHVPLVVAKRGGNTKSVATRIRDSPQGTLPVFRIAEA
jgi:DNA-binding HxlR family transcriptional regulator